MEASTAICSGPLAISARGGSRDDQQCRYQQDADNFHGYGNDRCHQQHEHNICPIRFHGFCLRKLNIYRSCKQRSPYHCQYATKTQGAADPDDGDIEPRHGQDIAEQESHQVDSYPRHECQCNQADRQSRMGKQAKQGIRGKRCPTLQEQEGKRYKNRYEKRPLSVMLTSSKKAIATPSRAACDSVSPK